jgi:hypothetical protein
VSVAADTMKIPFRSWVLFGMPPEAVDGIILQRRIKIGNHGGFKILKFKFDRITYNCNRSPLLYNLERPHQV